MAIISFWNSKIEETGKSSTIAAITTYLAINHNYKILVIDTKYNDYFFYDCFWKDSKAIQLKNQSKLRTGIGEGVEGLYRAILSSKTSPEIITNYTKVVFNENRLEILADTNVIPDEYEAHKKIFREIAKMADKYYDLVFIDLDSRIDKKTEEMLIECSDLVVACLPQKIRSIDEYINQKNINEALKRKTLFPIIGRYDSFSKYNQKNVTRYIKEKGGIGVIPYNTLFMEACNEGKVAEFFIKFRKINDKEKNAIFVGNIKNTAEKMLDRLREAQMMR